MSDHDDIERLYEALDGRSFGKYRGIVAANQDPLGEGRVQVQVPSVLGEELLWAMPCTPLAGPQIGFFTVPPVGARVWVEFEGGDRSYPIWSGCYWLPGQIPAEDADPNIAFLRTAGVSIRIDDRQGVIDIETAGGARLTISGNEITLEAASVKQTANGGATELTAGGFDAMNGALKVV